MSKYAADEETFFADIERITNVKAIVLDENSAKSRQKTNNLGARIMSISSFSPSPTKGGTIDAGDYITITGSGFGASAGTVFYSNADDGGATFTASGVASDNVSWSDGLIVNKVAAGAGNGPININGSFTSGSSLTVNNSHSAINSSFSGFGSATRQQYYLRNLNTLGGYSFLLNSTSGFSANSAAVDAFERALETRRCNSYINWRADGTTTSVFANDGLSVVLFDNTLPAGVLGRATSRFSGSSTGACNLTNTVWWVIEIDIQMAPDPPVTGFTWQFGPAAPSASQFDFESVLLHELGHAHGLGHVISSGAVMHYALFNGVTTRMPSVNEISAAVSKVNSSTAPTCFNPGGSGTQMIALTPSNCLTLPIELINFNAKNINNDIQLTWSTASEFNNDFFTVERSKDAINFETVGKVDGAGNSSGLKKYSLVDFNPYQGTSYYRLKQTDFDQRVTYSRIEEVNIESEHDYSFQIFPNPANDMINVQFYANNPGVSIVDIAEVNGKYVLSEKLDVSEGINKATINISSLSKGTYFITVHSKDKDYHTKLIKW